MTLQDAAGTVGLALLFLGIAAGCVFALWRLFRRLPRVRAGLQGDEFELWNLHIPQIGITVTGRTYLTYLLTVVPYLMLFTGLCAFNVLLKVKEVLGAPARPDLDPQLALVLFGGPQLLALVGLVLHIVVGLTGHPKFLVFPVYRHLPGRLHGRAAPVPHRRRGSRRNRD